MPSRRKIALIALSTTTLSACAHGGASSVSLTPSATNFTYYTPVSRVSLAGDLVLVRCDGGVDGVRVSASLALAASAGANTSAPFTLHGSSLMSALQRRELAIELNDNGTLKSVNATSTDRTGTVVTNILKTIGSIAGAILAPGNLVAGNDQGAPPSPCNSETRSALEQAAQFRAALDRLRRSLVGANPADIESIGARMELIAHQLALLITTQLTIPVSRQLELGDAPTAPGLSLPIRWTIGDLHRWFGNPGAAAACTPYPAAGGLFAGGGGDPCEASTDLLAMSYTIAADDVAPLEQRVSRSPCLAPSPGQAAECGRTVVMPRPARATVIVRTGTGNIAGQVSGAILGRAVVPMPQWGYATYLPLDVRLFQSRSVGYTFNAFGERRSFKWNSEAAAENATGAILSSTEAAAGVVETVRGPTETARLTAENAELEARMTNNRLRLCEQAILQGATTCD